MSGGSYDYVCFKIDEAADSLVNQKCPERRALGHLMHKIGKAMHDIEWVDSCDYKRGDEMEAIREVLNGVHMSPLDLLLEDARKLIEQLETFTADTERGQE